MPPAQPFQHLPLILRYQGPARIPGGGGSSPESKSNKEDPARHSRRLGGSASATADTWQTRQVERQGEGLPTLAAGVPLLLRVDPGLELDILREKFDFEIVSEQEDGFVIVASEELQLTAFLRMVNDFGSRIHGSSVIAQVHELVEDLTQDGRLRRILSESLFAAWPSIADGQDYIVDVSVCCLGTAEIPKPPDRPSPQGKKEKDATYANRLARWEAKRSDWERRREEAVADWAKLKMDREEDVHFFVKRGYGGEIIDTIDTISGDRTEIVTLPDSFTIRIKVNGLGLKDFVMNYAYIFEVVEPEGVELPQRAAEAVSDEEFSVRPQAPMENAPPVCVIDGGIQEAALCANELRSGLYSRPAEGGL